MRRSRLRRSEVSSAAEALVVAVAHTTVSDDRVHAEAALVEQTMVTSHRETAMGSRDALDSVDTSVSSNPIHSEAQSIEGDVEPKNLNERLAFLKRKRDAQQDAQDAMPSDASSLPSSGGVSGSSQSSLSSAPYAAQSEEIGGVSISAQSGGSGSLDEQIASLPSAFGSDANEHEPSTLIAPAPVLPPQEPSSETRQDLSSVEVPLHSSVDSTNPGLFLESTGQDVWLGQWIGEESQWSDEDPTFEVMIETLEVDELRMVEVLSAVKQMFWSKLRDLSRQCSNENVIAFLHSLDLSSIRMAIRETAQEVAEEIGEVYAQKLDELADARQLDMASRMKYILEQEHRDRIAGDIRTPFREFVERLERLDQARDSMLFLLNDQISAQLSRQKPLLSNALLEKLNQAEEPRGIELAWGLWLEALKRAMALYQAEAPEETAQLSLALEQFISQFDPTYSAILNRILEIWTDKLLPPLEALIDG